MDPFSTPPSTPTPTSNPYLEQTPPRTPLSYLGTAASPPKARLTSPAKMKDTYSFEKKGKNPAPSFIANIIDRVNSQHPELTPNAKKRKAAAFLKNENIPPNQRVAYLQKTQLQKLAITFNQGKAFLQNSPLGSEAAKAKGAKGELLYVLGQNNIFYSHQDFKPKAAQQEFNFHHSSFFSGDNVKCAGTWKASENGTILSLSNESGHYQPQAKHLVYACRMLEMHMNQKDFEQLDVEYHFEEHNKMKIDTMKAPDFLVQMGGHENQEFNS